MSNDPKNPKAPPIDQRRIGNIQVSIWARTTDKGTFYTASTRNSYKTADGYKISKTDTAADLASKLVLEKWALDTILDLQAEDVSDTAEVSDAAEDEIPAA